MFRALCFFLLLGSALAEDPLDALARAASSFSAAIAQQLQMLGRDPSPREFSQKTIDYATAKTAYFEALRAPMPALIKNALSEGKSQKLDAFITAFSVAGEKQQKLVEERTKELFMQFGRAPDIEWARGNSSMHKKSKKAFTRTSMDSIMASGRDARRPVLASVFVHDRPLFRHGQTASIEARSLVDAFQVARTS